MRHHGAGPLHRRQNRRLHREDWMLDRRHHRHPTMKLWKKKKVIEINCLNDKEPEEEEKKEGFTSYSGSPGGAKDAYQPIGAFDGIKLSTGNPGESWRYTKPNEPLNGYYPKFKVGPDNLFMFKDNQCKPECCGASFSCDGGCVCTTPEQRDYINTRGGNRTPGGNPDF
jgi:hypothetical protein